MTSIDVLKQQARDDLRQRFAALFARRGQLEVERKARADGSVVDEQIKRLDSDLELLCRDLADAERAFGRGAGSAKQRGFSPALMSA